MATPDIGKLDLSDDEDTDDLWASYSRPTANTKPDSRASAAEQAREEALKRELEGVRNINEVIEGVISSLERAKGSMDVCFTPP